MQKHSRTKPNSKEVTSATKPPWSVELMTERGGSGTWDVADADMMTAGREEQRVAVRKGRQEMDGNNGLNSCHRDHAAAGQLAAMAGRDKEKSCSSQ